jgi:hypothetical protein
VTTPTAPTKEQRERSVDRALERTTAAFVIRRPLDRATLGAALGAGLVAGAITAYLAAIWGARAPLDPLDPTDRRPGRRG